jgi:hypothetical protein
MSDLLDCMCVRCVHERTPNLLERQMPRCPTCGNKRCPHASDHDYACTGSNLPGQPGSFYQKFEEIHAVHGQASSAGLGEHFRGETDHDDRN